MQNLGTARVLTLLKIAPTPHRDFAAVKLAFILDTGLLRLFACRLPSIAPTEVIELPVGIRWKNEVPNREREEIN